MRGERGFCLLYHGECHWANARMAFAMIHTVDFTFSLRILAQTGKFVLHFLLSESRIITDDADYAERGVGDSQIPIQNVPQSFEKQLILPTPFRVIRAIRVLRDSDNKPRFKHPPIHCTACPILCSCRCSCTFLCSKSVKYRFWRWHINCIVVTRCGYVPARVV